MSRLMFGGLVAVVVMLGLGLGWWISTPPSLPRLHTSFQTAREAASNPPPKPTGADTAPGWERRKVLRDHLAAALEGMKANPCDPATRDAFFAAFTDRGWAMTQDGANSSDENGPAFWRTDDDRPLDQQLEKLQADRYVTTGELGQAMTRKRFGDNPPFKKVAIPAGMDGDRCAR